MLAGVMFVFSSGTFIVQLNRENDEIARKKGFADDSDRQKADKAGITDPAAWQEHQRLAEEAKEKEQRAQEEQKQRATALRQALLKPPLEEDRFIQAIEKARAAYKVGQTDLQRGATRPMRAREICDAVPSSELKQWVGKIHLLTTNGSGDGVLVVEISNGVKLVTMADSFSDSIYGTMIKPGSSLYQNLLEMKDGDFVRFDAGLFRSTVDCYKEMSLTMRGSIEEPEFVANFSHVARVDLPTQ